MYAVTIVPLNTICFLGDRPEETEWEVRENVGLDIPPNYGLSAASVQSPERVLCVSNSNPNDFKLFFHECEVDRNEFTPTGKNFGGVFSRKSWERFREVLPSALTILAVPENDPPGAFENALRAIREAR